MNWGAALAMIVVLALWAPAADAAFPGKNGRIVFARDDELFTIRPNGEDEERIARADYESHPTWAPDGRHIAYEYQRGIWVMRSDGSRKHRVTSGAEPAYSPGGGRLVFSDSRVIAPEDPAFECGFDIFWQFSCYHAREIWTVRTDGSGARQLTGPGPLDRRSRYTDSQPEYSPDGSHVVFTRNVDQVWIMRANGSGERRLTQGESPTFSPSGDRILFKRKERLYSMRANGSNVRRVLDTKYPGPVGLSPNGRRIVYAGRGSTSEYPETFFTDLFTVRLNGEGKRRLASYSRRSSSNYVVDLMPDWGVRIERSGSSVTCRGKEATIVGGAGDDVVRGTPRNDVIVGTGGDDTIKARAGRDIVCSLAGSDAVWGGKGWDRLFGGRGNDRLAGNKGSDSLIGHRGFDRCWGGKGSDTARCERTRSA